MQKTFIQQYGPIFTVWLGPYPVVLISDYELAVDAMVKKGQYLIDRWEPPIVAAMNGMLRLASTLSSFQDFRWQRTGFIKWRLLGRTKTLRFAHLEKFGYLKEHNGRKDHGRVPFEASMICLSSFSKIWLSRIFGPFSFDFLIARSQNNKRVLNDHVYCIWCRVVIRIRCWGMLIL